jgi:hypothetical protein
MTRLLSGSIVAAVFFYLVSRTAYWLIMNPDYCNCDEFYKVIEFQDIQYYKSEDDRFGDVKK